MDNLELSPSEAEHLLYLLEVNKREGWYQGNKLHYWRRHDKIVGKLKGLWNTKLRDKLSK